MEIIKPKTNAELNKELEATKKVIRLILTDIKQFGKVSMCDAEDYLKLL